MRPNLFQWDLIAVGSGYKSLSRFDFDDARNRFSRVLTAKPDQLAAGQGMAALRFWEDVFCDMEGLDRGSKACFLWDRITAFSFANSESGQSLRLSLIRGLFTSPSVVIVEKRKCCIPAPEQAGDTQKWGRALFNNSETA